jgi:hemerythrin-like metal-binding protein
VDESFLKPDAGGPMITWDESMSTGLADIDAQHKEIISKFNDFSKAIEHGQGADLNMAGEILDFLQFYAVWHFEREEKCMAQYRCPVAEKNKKAHAEFVEKFTRFYEHWQENGLDISVTYQTFFELEEWIRTHIGKIDTQLKACISDEP